MMTAINYRYTVSVFEIPLELLDSVREWTLTPGRCCTLVHNQVEDSWLVSAISIESADRDHAQEFASEFGLTARVEE